MTMALLTRPRRTESVRIEADPRFADFVVRTGRASFQVLTAEVNPETGMVEGFADGVLGAHRIYFRQIDRVRHDTPMVPVALRVDFDLGDGDELVGHINAEVVRRAVTPA